MQTYIALLRGINVSGKNKILMADLKLFFNDLGFKEVQTYIQSGNVIFKSLKNNKKEIAELISKKIKKVFKYEVPVILKTKKELKEIIAGNPFIINSTIETKKLYVAYLNQTLKETKKIKEFDFGNDVYKVVNDIVYLKYAIGAGKTKLTNNIIEKKLDVIATTRNWRTTCKLLELIER